MTIQTVKTLPRQKRLLEVVIQQSDNTVRQFYDLLPYKSFGAVIVSKEAPRKRHPLLTALKHSPAIMRFVIFYYSTVLIINLCSNRILTKCVAAGQKGP